MKRLLTICLLMCLLAFSVPAHAATTQGVFRVDNCEEWISLREMPSTGSERLVKIPKNGLVTYIAPRSNGFCFVGYAGQYGYVLSKYLRPQNRAMIVGNCEDYAVLFEEPGEESTHLVSVPNGARVVLIAPAENGYFQVSYEGTIGYIQSDKLFGIQPQQVEEAVVTNCNSFISLRSLPMTSAERLAKIPLGAEVRHFGPVGNGMSYVYYNGQYGFALTKYLDYEQSLACDPVRRATLTLVDPSWTTASQTISDPELLGELQAMVLRATPEAAGKCPPYGKLTFEMQDGRTLQFTRVTDGCPDIIDANGIVRKLTKADADRFWEIFDEVYAALCAELPA